VLTDSSEVAKWGAPTFDAWIVRRDSAAKNPEFVALFARVTGAAYAAYNKDPKAFSANPANVDKIVRLTGAKKEEIAELLAGSQFPALPEQAALLSSGTVKAVTETSQFLREQGKIDKVLPDYQPYVTPRFVQAAAKSAAQQVATKAP